MLIFSIVIHTPVTYGVYSYPSWAVGVGWVFALCSMLPLPIIFIRTMLQAKGSILQVSEGNLGVWCGVGVGLVLVLPVSLSTLCCWPRDISSRSVKFILGRGWVLGGECGQDVCVPPCAPCCFCNAVCQEMSIPYVKQR